MFRWASLPSDVLRPLYHRAFPSKDTSPCILFGRLTRQSSNHSCALPYTEDFKLAGSKPSPNLPV